MANDESDLVTREVAWLTAVDDLPPLLVANGGPWQLVQGYWPRTPRTLQSAIYVLPTQIDEERAANIRIQPHYDLLLKLLWPATRGDGDAEKSAAALMAALVPLLARIRGKPGDHSHGGKFQAVAEWPKHVVVDIEDPEHTLPESVLRARVRYAADDYEITG